MNEIKELQNFVENLDYYVIPKDYYLSLGKAHYRNSGLEYYLIHKKEVFSNVKDFSNIFWENAPKLSEEEIKHILNNSYGKCLLSINKKDLPSLNVEKVNSFFETDSAKKIVLISKFFESSSYISEMFNVFFENKALTNIALLFSTVKNNNHSYPYELTNSKQVLEKLLTLKDKVSSYDFSIFMHDVLTNSSLFSKRDSLEKRFTDNWIRKNIDSKYHDLFELKEVNNIFYIDNSAFKSEVLRINKAPLLASVMSHHQELSIFTMSNHFTARIKKLLTFIKRKSAKEKSGISVEYISDNKDELMLLLSVKAGQNEDKDLADMKKRLQLMIVKISEYLNDEEKMKNLWDKVDIDNHLDEMIVLSKVTRSKSKI